MSNPEACECGGASRFDRQHPLRQALDIRLIQAAMCWHGRTPPLSYRSVADRLGQLRRSIWLSGVLLGHRSKSGTDHFILH